MNHSNGLIFLAVFFIVLVSCNCLSIGTVSEVDNANKSVLKRDASEEFFPDWVPFKNKKGEELGEFVQVRKAKPKKRLALPVSFVLRAVAEPQGDDYYGQGQGEIESDDYYEKKEWSDVNRPPDVVSKDKVVKHTELSDIDGVVNIITQRPGRVISRNSKKQKTETPDAENDRLKKMRERETEITEEKAVKDTPKEDIPEDTQENIQEEGRKDAKEEEKEEAAREELNEEPKNETNSKEKKDDVSIKDNKQDVEEDNDYEDERTEKSKSQMSEEERREQEERKAKILESVDKLKERHANEQRLLSEKLKEEEMFVEEAERDKLNSNQRHDKYGHVMRHRPVDYEDYDDNIFVGDKYKIQTLKRSTTTVATPKRQPKRKKQKRKGNPENHHESGKLSVFKHPSAYMIYDYDDYKTKATTTERPDTSYSSSPISAHSTNFDNSTNDSERISLVPEDNDGKQGEPTLFFPRKRKNRRRKHKSTSAPPLDSSVAETVTKKAETGFTANDVSGFSSSPSATGISSPSISYTTGKESSLLSSLSSAKSHSAPDITSISISNTAPSGFATAPSAPDTHEPGLEDKPGVTGLADATSPGELRVLAVNGDLTSAVSAPSSVAHDTVPAPSDHKKEVPKHDNFEHERGGDKEHHSEHEESHEEHGKKAYEGVHKDTKTKKGHHDKEDHRGDYHDHGGFDKNHHDEKGHYGAHHHEEHGKKHAKYEESGKHSKGHSTKGSHDIHKKEEYEKNVEFFEEEGDSAEEEKHGGHTHEKSHESGGKFKKDNLAAGFYGQLKGDSGKFAKGGQDLGHKGHKSSAGHDSHGKHGANSFHESGKDSGKKWIYHHGHPAKSANLIVIDRRADALYHGPQYYG